jgi:hypothetical protein
MIRINTIVRSTGKISAGSYNTPLADVDIIFTGGTNYTSSSNQWYGLDTVSDFCMYGAGYLPGGQDSYIYATVDLNTHTFGIEAAKESALKLMTSTITSCDPADPWSAPSKYAIFPNSANSFYRLWEDGVGFTLTGTTYADQDLYGLFVSNIGTVKAKYYRSGVWTDLHTFANIYTGNLYIAARGLYWTYIVNPKASSNKI